jgi:hypothetical protein
MMPIRNITGDGNAAKNRGKKSGDHAAASRTNARVIISPARYDSCTRHMLFVRTASG